MGGGTIGIGPSAGGTGIPPGGGGVGGGALVGESPALAAMPAMSEHSRASRPLKRPAVPELGGGAGYSEVPRSMSHPSLGRGGNGGVYPHMDLQQQLNSLQAQVRTEGLGK